MAQPESNKNLKIASIDAKFQTVDENQGQQRVIKKTYHTSGLSTLTPKSEFYGTQPSTLYNPNLGSINQTNKIPPASNNHLSSLQTVPNSSDTTQVLNQLDCQENVSSKILTNNTNKDNSYKNNNNIFTQNRTNNSFSPSLQTKDSTLELKNKVNKLDPRVGVNGETRQEDINLTENKIPIVTSQKQLQAVQAHKNQTPSQTNLVPSSAFSKMTKPQIKLPVTGPGINSAMVNTTAQFFIDLADAGSGQVGIGIMGPSDAAAAMQSLANNKIKVTYTPKKAGTYKITLKYDNQEIEGSPFVVTCLNEDGSEGIQIGGGANTSSSEDGKKVQIATVNSQCNFNLRLSNIDSTCLKQELKDPNGKVTAISHQKIEQDVYNISFTPTIKGKHILTITYKNSGISGSPYIIDVQDEIKGDAKKCTAYGDGKLSGRCNIPCKFKVDVSKAGGSGQLSVDIRGPSEPSIQFKSDEEIEYKVSQPGKYTINVKFNNDHIQGSPFVANITN